MFTIAGADISQDQIRLCPPIGRLTVHSAFLTSLLFLASRVDLLRDVAFLMAKMPSPDGRLVYLYCSSIFNGANAQVRRAKKITQLLEEHKKSIKILTKEFALPSIVAVVKELLEERIFESLPRAKLRYPELFQPSEKQVAERAASEDEVIRVETAAVEDIVLTSDDEGEEEYLDIGQSGRQAEREGTSKNTIKARDDYRIGASTLWQVQTLETT